MKIDTEHFKAVILDEQEVWVADRFALNNLERFATGGSTIQKLLQFMRDFVVKHRGFALGFFNAGPNLGWVASVLLGVGNQWQRVQIEELRCTSCGWRGFTANPLDDGLYDGVPNRLAALTRAAKIPLVGCPSCRTALPRPAIWVDTAASEVREEGDRLVPR